MIKEECDVGVLGWVYLIRLDKRYPNGKNPQYYIGWTEIDPLKRLEEHRSNKGSTFLKNCNRLDISYKIVRVWRRKDRNFERKLKKRGHYYKNCPIYNKKLWRHKAHKFIKH